MDPEFQRALLIVSAVGTLIVAVGVTVLVFAFRAFGKKSSPALIGVLVLFVFACCFGLFLLSRVGQ